MKKKKLLRLIVFLLVISLSLSNFIFSIFADEPIRIKMKGKGVKTPYENYSSNLGKFKLGSESDGFRDIEWGTNISTLSGMISIGSGMDGAESYIREGDILEIGGAKLEIIVYSFWEDKFFNVKILSKDIQSFEDTIFEKFGKGYSFANNTHFWAGEKTTMSLSYVNGIGEFSMFSTKIYEKILAQIKAHRKEKAKEGAKTGF